jgi:hypothetical protein
VKQVLRTLLGSCLIDVIGSIDYHPSSIGAEFLVDHFAFVSFIFSDFILTQFQSELASICGSGPFFRLFGNGQGAQLNFSNISMVCG